MLTPAEINEVLAKPNRRAPAKNFVATRLANKEARKRRGLTLRDLTFREWFETEWIPAMGGAAY